MSKMLIYIRFILVLGGFGIPYHGIILDCNLAMGKYGTWQCDISTINKPSGTYGKIICLCSTQENACGVQIFFNVLQSGCYVRNYWFDGSQTTFTNWRAL